MATVLAAGVASLTLACCKIDNIEVDNLEREKKVRDVLEAVKGGNPNSKYVWPWIVFGEKARGDGDKMFLLTADRKG